MVARPKVAAILEDVGSMLNALPGVFSTPQWGGRAYKLPGRGGRRDKPKLVAFVAAADDGRAVTVSFKLEPRRAADSIEAHGWIEPHSFRTLAPSGWVTANVTTKRQAGLLRPLLKECHALLAPPQESKPGLISAAEIRPGLFDSVMAEARSRGWSPPADLSDDGEWPSASRA